MTPNPPATIVATAVIIATEPFPSSDELIAATFSSGAFQSA